MKKVNSEKASARTLNDTIILRILFHFCDNKIATGMCNGCDLLSKEQKVQVSDTTKFNSSNAV